MTSLRPFAYLPASISFCSLRRFITKTVYILSNQTPRCCCISLIALLLYPCHTYALGRGIPRSSMRGPTSDAISHAMDPPTIFSSYLYFCSHLCRSAIRTYGPRY